MLKNYFLMALRNIKNQKLYSSISIFGLAIGMAVSFIIIYYVMYEFGFDKFQNNYKRINMFYWGDGDKKWGTTPFVLADVIRNNNYNQIEKIAQVSFGNHENPNLVINNEFVSIDNFFYSDPEIFDILSIKILNGSLDNFKNDINSIILSQKVIRQYFNNEDMVGKLIIINKSGKSLPFKVAAIIADVPTNSHFRPEYIVPMTNMKSRIPKQFISHWGMNSPVTYLLMKKGADYKSFENNLNRDLKNIMPKEMEIEYHLLPLGDLHLYAYDILDFYGEKGSINKIYIFSTVAFLILLIACINFININTARSVNRYKEMGLRKVFGANRFSLINQVLTESTLIALISLPIALFIIEILLPYAGNLLARNLNLNYLYNWRFSLLVIIITSLTGIISGIYTALSVSKNTPIEILRNKFKMRSTKSGLRRLLISIQFVIFISLLVSSYVIYSQMAYIQNTDLGYDRKNIIVTNLSSNRFDDKCSYFINELKKYPQIIDASVASSIPPAIGSTLSSECSSIDDPGKNFSIQFITCNPSFQSTMGIELKKGRFISQEDELILNFGFFDETSNNEGEINNRKNKVGKAVINETAEKEFGFTDAIGKTLIFNGKQVEITGVVKDFHTKSFYEPINPLIILSSKSFLNKIAIRYKAGEVKNALELIKIKWKEFFPLTPIDYAFLDQEFNKIYIADEEFCNLITFFTIISIFVAAIGLAGLISYSSAQKFKEIGIRKVLGATIGNIINLMIKEIVIISIISCFISFPMTFYLMNKWLENYAFKIRITFSIYLFVLIVTLLIASSTVVFQILKAARSNPVKALRSE